MLDQHQGSGWRNVTNLGHEIFQKSNTYHWDTQFGPDGRLEGHGPDNPHATIPHLQLHPDKGPIVRIFFTP